MKHKPAAKKSLRPTTSKVREAVFDILQDKIRDARFLDLYAGTGVIGIEAARKGASEVVLIDESKKNAQHVSNLIRKFRLVERARIITKKTLSFIEWAEANQLSFDIIFLDPPYHSDEIIYVMTAIDQSTVLDHNGMVIAEHFKKRELPEKFDKLHKIKDYRYGDTVLSVYVTS